MPSGYTAKIADGITFREFALDCARAFGACITLRDDPGGGEAIPERFEPADYYAKRVEECRARLADLEAMTPEQIEEEGRAYNERRLADHARRVADNAALRSKYESMRRAVKDWTPPTPDHTSMKVFMLSQINVSVDFDCHKFAEPVSVEPSKWHEDAVVGARDALSRAVEAERQERERVASRNEWIARLRDSLPPKED